MLHLKVRMLPEFIEYARNGDLEKVKELYNHHFNWLTYDCAIRYASDNGHLEIIKYFLEQREFRSEYIFIKSCENGHLLIVKYCLEQQRVKNDEYDFCIKRGFIHACKNGYLEVVKYLLEYLSSLDKTTLIEETFKEACHWGQLEIIKFLLEQEPKTCIPLLIKSIRLIDQAKVEILKIITSKIKIKYWIIGCLYNPNLKIGRWYTDKLILEDNELVK